MKINHLISLTLLYKTQSIKISKTHSKWEDFKTNFSKIYADKNEESIRFHKFIKNLKSIEEHNNNPKHSYTKGINQFSDLSFEEFDDIYLMKRKSVGKLVNGKLPYPEDEDQFECPTAFKKSMDIPEKYQTNLDWRVADIDKNPTGHSAVVAVKDQGACGSCYVFSATGAMEGSACKEGFFNCDPITDENETRFRGFAEQQALNCASYDYTVEERNWYVGLGCYGGFPSNTLEYFYNTQGVTCEWHIPYESGNATRFDNDLNVGECPYSGKTQWNYFNENSHGFVKKSVCGTTSKNSNTDANDVKQALYEKGPLSMAMYVTDEFKQMNGGIYIPGNECANFTDYGLNHAMLFVGYGTDVDSEGNKTDYWIVKNSWSESWGEQGFVKVVRGQNACGCEGNIAYVEMDRIMEDDVETTTFEMESTTDNGSGSGDDIWLF